jgi:aldehyde:ferredoxin oxidoreductase
MIRFPSKFFDQPLTKGKYEGAVLDREKFEQMKDEYYDLRGWDKQTGIPTGEKLRDLGLADGDEAGRADASVA